MKKLLLLLLISITTAALAQPVVNVDQMVNISNTISALNMGGQPYQNIKYIRLVSGSPYFSEEWMKGWAITSKGIRYKGDQLKMDLIENELHFLDKEGKELIATVSFDTLKLVDPKESIEHKFIKSTELSKASGNKGWYYELVTGRASAYKYIKKFINETRPYNSATYEQQVLTIEEYFIIENGVVSKIKKLKELPKILNSHKEQMESFVNKADNSKDVMEGQLKIAIQYYNSLSGS
jgi:hypothetical protein